MDKLCRPHTQKKTKSQEQIQKKGGLKSIRFEWNEVIDCAYFNTKKASKNCQQYSTLQSIYDPEQVEKLCQSCSHMIDKRRKRQEKKQLLLGYTSECLN